MSNIVFLYHPAPLLLEEGTTGSDFSSIILYIDTTNTDLLGAVFMGCRVS